MSATGLGEPIELPWWVFALSAPPTLLALISLVIPSSIGVHLLALIPAIVLIWSIARVALRVQSANMQSVWISLAYGVWAAFPIAYIAAVIAKP